MSPLDFLLIGVIGGLTPGPITALLLGETFKNGIRKGIQVPFAMLCTNLFFSVGTVSLLMVGQQLGNVLEILPIAGGCLLIFLGGQEWQASGELKFSTASHPFVKAFLIDFVNPHPYLVWLTVLAPGMVLSIHSFGLASAIPLWALFIFGLCGTKFLLVLLANVIRPFLTPEILKIILKCLALLLVGFGVKLLI